MAVFHGHIKLRESDNVSRPVVTRWVATFKKVAKGRQGEKNNQKDKKPAGQKPSHALSILNFLCHAIVDVFSQHQPCL